MNWFNPEEASVHRVEAQQFIMSAVRRDIPGSQVIGILQRNDTWYNAREFGEDWQHWKEAWNRGRSMAFVNRDKRPGEQLYIESHGLRSSKYQTIMEIRGIDLETGDPFTQDVTVLHTHTIDGIEIADETQMFTRRELEDLAERYLDWYGLRETIEVSSIMPVMGYVNSNF